MLRAPLKTACQLSQCASVCLFTYLDMLMMAGVSAVRIMHSVNDVVECNVEDCLSILPSCPLK